MAELLPCPFCGSKEIRFEKYDPCDGYQGDLSLYEAHCTNCACTIMRTDKDECIKAWNTRERKGV